MSPFMTDPIKLQQGGGGSNLQVAAGGFNAPNSSVSGTQVSVTGLSFTPVLVLLWTICRTETSDAAVISSIVDTRPSFGAFTATEQYAWGSAQKDAQATSSCAGIHRNDACLILMSTTPDFRGLVFHSMNSDGFTIKVSTNGTAGWNAGRIHYLALAGSDLANVKINTVSVTAASGSKAFTPLSFTPNCIIFPNYNAAINTNSGLGAQQTIGFATSSSAQYVWGGFDRSAQNFTNTGKYSRTDECCGNIDPDAGGMTTRAGFTSMDATGWTFNSKDTAGGSWTQPYIALNGIKAAVGNFTANSGGASISGLGFKPKAMILLTHGTTQSTADTIQDHFNFSIGVALQDGTQLYMCARSPDNVDTSDITTAMGNSGSVVTVTNAGAVDSRISISMDSDGFSYTMPVSTLSGHLVGYLALG